MDNRKQVKDEERALLFKAAILGLAINTDYESHGEIFFKDKPVRTRNQLAGYYGFETGAECYTKVIEPTQYGTDYFSVKGKEAYDLAVKLDSFIPYSWHKSPSIAQENLVTPTGIIKSIDYAPLSKSTFTLAEVLVDLIGDVNNYNNKRFEDFAYDIQKQLDTFKKQCHLTPEQQEELQTKPVIKDNDGTWIVRNKYTDIIGLHSPRDIAIRLNIRDKNNQPYEELLLEAFGMCHAHDESDNSSVSLWENTVKVRYGIIQGNTTEYETEPRLNQTGLKHFIEWWHKCAHAYVVNKDKRIIQFWSKFQLSENYPLPSKPV